MLTRHGGVFVKDLDVKAAVTHLLCGMDRPPEARGDAWTAKMHVACKYNTSAASRIQMVWEEWFWDCLECGGA